ncbi:hypothetical protein ABZ319_14465, partial [Nocardia sp. NPDC005978]
PATTVVAGVRVPLHNRNRTVARSHDRRTAQPPHRVAAGIATTATGGMLSITEAPKLAEGSTPYVLVVDANGRPLHLSRGQRLASVAQTPTTVTPMLRPSPLARYREPPPSAITAAKPSAIMMHCCGPIVFLQQTLHLSHFDAAARIRNAGRVAAGPRTARSRWYSSDSEFKWNRSFRSVTVMERGRNDRRA